MRSQIRALNQPPQRPGRHLAAADRRGALSEVSDMLVRSRNWPCRSPTLLQRRRQSEHRRRNGSAGHAIWTSTRHKFNAISVFGTQTGRRRRACLSTTAPPRGQRDYGEDGGQSFDVLAAETTTQRVTTATPQPAPRAGVTVAWLKRPYRGQHHPRLRLPAEPAGARANNMTTLLEHQAPNPRPRLEMAQEMTEYTKSTSCCRLPRRCWPGQLAAAGSAPASAVSAKERRANAADRISIVRTAQGLTERRRRHEAGEGQSLAAGALPLLTAGQKQRR
jgi:hypothetical protein